jgi:urease subunit alpha
MMESVRRTIQLAHVMKAWRGTEAGAGHRGEVPEPAGEFNDNARLLRYLAKVTIEPAITHGLADHVGSLRAGRLADIVLWHPGFFGVKPELVLKSGLAAWAPLGEGNATVERAEPTRYRPHWGGSATVAAGLGITFVAPGMRATVARRLREGFGGHRPVAEIGRTRGITRNELALNRAVVPIEIDVVDGRVSLDGRPLAAAAVAEVPLSRRYLLR